jgi:transcriptional regulator with XRE-family HTH domain
MYEESLAFGLNLKVARVRKQLTQGKLAEKMTAAGIKCSADSISKIERGERVVNKKFIRTAANILKCSTYELTKIDAVEQTPAQKLVAALRNTADLMEQVYSEK